MNTKTPWITSVIPEQKEPLPYLTLFRKELFIGEEDLPASITITADTRYKLYVNGILTETGPSRGDHSIWFYDEIELTPFLHPGKNIIAVSILRYPENTDHSNHGMARTDIPGLYAVLHTGKKEVPADHTWKWKRAGNVSFYREEVRFAPLNIHEKSSGDPALSGWNTCAYDDSSWTPAMVYTMDQLPHLLQPAQLKARTIPFMKRIPHWFSSVKRIIASNLSVTEWNAFLEGKSPVTIEPNNETIVEIDAGEEMTGYLSLKMEHGKDADIELLYSEAYVQEGFEGPEQHPIKKDREDSIHGHLDGYSDFYHVSGHGEDTLQEEYSPYWFRTFRFLRFTVKTKAEPITLCSLDYEEVGYPLEVKSHVCTSDPTLEKIWEISERTLRRCMQETYIDCPFYEQLQYISDSRLQILYTYASSADDRLARKCIDDLARSQRKDGLLNASAPNRTVNVIPTFSIYFILMVYDHLLYFGDRKFAASYLPVIRKILSFFETHTEKEGYVSSIGGINEKAPFWSYIDWAKEWNDTTGVPPAGLQGPITMETLLYIYGLEHAEEIAHELRSEKDALHWEACRKRAVSAVKDFCLGKNGMIMDGPGVEQYSQHSQVFGILTGIFEDEDARNALRKTIEEPGYAQCSIAMRYYLFRALEKTGMYEYSDQYYEAWRNMLKLHCTTCVESEAYARSECHAWGALVLYELPSVTLGVRPASFGYETVSIHPLFGYMTEAEGTVITPKGPIHVSWKNDGHSPELKYTLPEGMRSANDVDVCPS